jgi:quercetin dioxygenase-like cupin family protein
MRRPAILAFGLSLTATTVVCQTAPTALHWGPAPAVFPKGAKMAVVSGDPSKPAMFTIELAMPAGYKIPPHFHPTDEHVTVKGGTFLVGMGDVLDEKHARVMAAGDSGTISAEMHHFAVARTRSTVEVVAMGPFAMTYVRPEDDPQEARRTVY